jgi:riboflavin kinase/FMN adenylyltransferase
VTETAIAIGNFDGVHRGHQVVLRALAEDARRVGIAPRVLTFEPHPRAVLGGGGPALVPSILTTPARKRELLHRVDPAIELLVQRFDVAFASQSPEAFASDVLAGALGAKVVVVGANFRFGKDRAGGLDDLRRLGEAVGFEARTHALEGDEGRPWSSSRIREAIARGDLAEAERLLGRPHMISGVVVAGDRRGRTIGFPTCNLEDVAEALPPHGVYAVLVDREAGGRAGRLAKGVANFGVRPTIEGTSGLRIEAHLFDFAEDLYGARLRVHVVARLRAEMRFTGLDALKAQIARDAEAAREALAAREPDTAADGAWA